MAETTEQFLERVRNDLYGNGEDGLVHEFSKLKKEHQSLMQDIWGVDRRGGQTGLVDLLSSVRTDLTTLNTKVEQWFAQITTGLKVAIVLLAGGFLIGVIQFAQDLLGGRL